MAGIFGARIPTTSVIALPCLYKPPQSLHLHSKHHLNFRRDFLSQIVKRAERQNGSHQVGEEPATNHNGDELSEKAVLPLRGSPLSAGYDLALVPTDVSIAVPEGTPMLDADYRGPVGLIMFNHSVVDFEVKVE